MTKELHAALHPFLVIAKACEGLHHDEVIAARAVGGNEVATLCAGDFLALAAAIRPFFVEEPAGEHEESVQMRRKGVLNMIAGILEGIGKDLSTAEKVELATILITATRPKGEGE